MPVARLSAVVLICGLSALPFGAVYAQQTQAPVKQAAPAEAPQFKEVALTDKQVEGVLAAQKDLDAIAAKIPQPKENEPPRPDPAIAAQFEGVAKKNGFASYAEYNDVVLTISLVLNGFDGKTKTYIGPEAALKQQLAAVQADTKIPANDKKAVVEELNDALKSPPPQVQNKANIDLVVKYYDKLAAAIAEDN